MTRSESERGPALVLAGAVALLVGILAIAVADMASRPGPGGEAARLVPAGALAFVSLSTDPADPAARRLRRLAPRIPGYQALRAAALSAVSPGPGAFDPQRDVRPWLGDEAAVALVDGAPAAAVALLTGPSLAEAVRAVRRAGAGATFETVRTALRESVSLDLERDLLGRLRGEFSVWLEPGGAAPVITLAARTSDPGGVREVLARLQDPVARALAGSVGATPAFAARSIAGADAFTLQVSDGFAPSYAVAGDTVLVSTSPAGVDAFRRRGPRLRSTRAFRAAVPRIPARIESLGFVDVRQLLVLGEQTGLTAEVLRPVSAAAAVIEREKDDTTAELFFEIL